MSVEIVAEISGNHGGSINHAFRLISEAKKAGADAVKFQCFEPDRLAMKRAADPYVLELAGGRSLISLYGETHTPKEWFPSMIAKAEMEGIAWFSSVFDSGDVAFLETLNCPRYKISAFEMLDGHLINAVKATGKPIIISVRPRQGLTILAATAYGQYAAFQDFGISDHAPFNYKSVQRSALGSPMIERHLRLADVETPDAEFSSTPEEFARYVAAIRGA